MKRAAKSSCGSLVDPSAATMNQRLPSLSFARNRVSPGRPHPALTVVENQEKLMDLVI